MVADFRGKTVVITGGSSGIGAACARLFAADGANLVLAARTAAPLEALASELSEQGVRAVPVSCDVSDFAQCEQLIARATSEFATLDVLVNNAGMNLRGPIAGHDAAALAQMVAVNLAAPVALIRLALPHLERSRGAIVNVASLAGRVPLAGEAVYSASKFGVRALSLALAEELADIGVRVAVVSPGPVDTGFIMDEIDEVPDIIFSQPISTAEDIARLVVQSALDGQPERMRPRFGGYLATVGYVFPRVRRMLLPLLRAKGRRAKDKLRRTRA